MKGKLLAVCALSFFLSSCIVATRPGRAHRHSRSCHPSEYWDGHRCVHKGKAKGHKKPKKAKKHRH